MDNRSNKNSRARRRPESIQKYTVQPQSGTRSGESGSLNRAHSADARSQKVERTPDRVQRNSVSSGRHVTERRNLDLSPADEKKILREERRMIKAEERQISSERREMRWQNAVVRINAGPDKILAGLIVLLVFLGSVAVFSSSYPYAIKEGLDSYAFVKEQLKFIGFGLIAFFIAYLIPFVNYRVWIPIAVYGIGAVLLVAALFVGTKEGVTTRWIDLGPINIQPSEVMKVGVIMLIAWYADRYGHKMRDLDSGLKSLWWNTLIPDLIVGGACILVLAGKHLSGTIIVGLIGVFLLIVAGCKGSWLFKTITPVAVVAISYYFIENPYALSRLLTFKNANADKLDELYQTTQSLYAIGSGGLYGVGFGDSRQKFSYLSAAHTDFIFSIWCEETGFIGAVALIIIFMLLIWRGYVVALRAPDKFTMLLAFGITTHIGLQTFLNMYVATDLMVNTGVTLPFFSYGGSALVITLAEMGLLLRISRQYFRKKTDVEHDEMARQAGLL